MAQGRAPLILSAAAPPFGGGRTAPAGHVPSAREKSRRQRSVPVPRGCVITLLVLSTLSGLMLALTAMAVIILNETQADVAGLARESRAIRRDDPTAAPAELVSLTGTIGIHPPLGDEQFLAPGQYLFVE